MKLFQFRYHTRVSSDDPRYGSLSISTSKKRNANGDSHESHLTRRGNIPASRAVFIHSDKQRMQAVKNAFSASLNLLKPSWYAGQYRNFVLDVNKQLVAGSIKPLFRGMFYVGALGYTFEYLAVGRKYFIICKNNSLIFVIPHMFYLQSITLQRRKLLLTRLWQDTIIKLSASYFIY